jgi:hypothetical protein
MNLIEGIQQELDRNRELLQEYKNIGPAGMFGATMIQNAIKTAEKAIAHGDTIQMLKSYNELKETQ